ncbi:putative TMEM220 protein [Rosa chinensis]|uniref:Putative TMEM220 protein n=1 Tax=Rosa chinensis TaxID=74649 RepID=A0A2P6RMT0_ROSCH|nr:transmembrane protein 220 [Rosa chinensis]PRQ47740.1 putative TMEM220 protein [Rosa chinensis]
MATPSKLYTLCSLLMAALFAYSAAVQLNDPDWYFWFLLYAVACVVNLVNWAITSKKINQFAEAALWLGMFLFIKVLAEDFVNGISGFWSLDLSERVIREKIGSGLVIISMVLQLMASLSSPEAPTQKRPRYLEYGMGILVGFGYALPFVFFVVLKGEMKF